MSDFYKARFCAEYEAEGGNGDVRVLTVPGQYLTGGEPAREWSAETSSHNLAGSPYGLDVPAGNARLQLSWEALVRRPTVAELERWLRRTEIALNTQRAGTLELAEAYHGGAPTLLTRWRAVVTGCTARRLTEEDAPAEPGAWGAVAYAFTLTRPEEV